jgi:hypothetical protein
MIEKDNQQTDFQLSRRQKWSRCAGPLHKAGLIEVQKHLFTTRDYVRGHGMGLADWDPADGEGFHLVLKRSIVSA